MTKLNQFRGILPDADVVEKIALLILFSFLAWRMIGAYLDKGVPIVLLFIIDQAILIAFILIRRRTHEISRRSIDWALGFAGTCLPLLLVAPSETPLLPLAFCNSVMILGIAIHLWAKLTLRRSFGVVAANRGVKLSGPYRAIRHPMYAGYIVSQSSLLLAGPNLTNALLLTAAWASQIGRILVEERMLRSDPKYQALMQRTRYRLIPGVF